jgi:hypothetical protein
MPSQSADLLRYERSIARANAIDQQYNKASTVGFIVRSYGSTVDVTTDGTNRIRVAYLGGSIRVGDAVNVTLRGYKGTKGFEAL